MKYSKSFYFQNNVIEIKSNVNVLKNTKEVFNFSINLRDTSLKKIYYKNIDDPYPDNIDLNYLLPTVNGNLIRCDYVLKISCHFETLVPYENRPRVFLPLNIGHQGKNNLRMSILHNNEKNIDINEEKIDIENDLMFDDFVVIDDDNENEKDFKSELIIMDREFSIVNDNDNYFQSMPLKNFDYQNNIINKNNNKNINKYPNLNEKNNNQINNQNNNINPNFINHNNNNNNYSNFIPNLNININNNFNNFKNNQNILNSDKKNNELNSQNLSNNNLNIPNLDNKNQNIYNINQNYNNNEYQNPYPIFSDPNS